MSDNRTAALFQLFADYGIFLVLLALCICFSVATYEEQDPRGAAAGAQLARLILSEHGENPRVIVLAPDTTEGRELSQTLAELLDTRGLKNVETVEGEATAWRAALQAAAEKKQPIDVVACDASALAYSFIRDLGGQYPELASTQVVTARKYYWPTFLTGANFRAISNRIAVIAIIAIAMTLVIITAGIDLSVGSLIAFSAVVATWQIRAAAITETTVSIPSLWFVAWHFSYGLALLVGGIVFLASKQWSKGAALVAASLFLPYVALLFLRFWIELLQSIGPTPACMVLCCSGAILLCACIGAFNGTMVTVFRVPPFIVTLAMMLIARSLAKIIADNETIYQGIPESFKTLGTGLLVGIPYTLILMLVLYVAGHVLMTRTVLGRYIYAVGGNPDAARLSGVPVKRVVLYCYIACGAMAGVGGIITASELNMGKATFGNMAELDVIAAVVVGGASLAGGRGKVLGTLIGALITGVVLNGMNLTNIDSNVQGVVLGSVILAAVLLDQAKGKIWERLSRSPVG